MANEARVSLVGNLIAEPKNSQYNNSTVLSFGVSVRTTKKQENSQYYESDIYNVSVWGKTAEYLMTVLQKGTMVWVEGDLMMRTYKNRDGQDRTTPAVTAAMVKVLAKGKGSKPAQTQNTETTEDDDNPPF